MKALTDSEIRADRLRSEIAQLEARYDGLFPPGVYTVLESLRQKLIALQRTWRLTWPVSPPKLVSRPQIATARAPTYRADV